MLSLTVTEARNIAFAAVIGLVLLMAVMAWLIKSVVLKLVTVVILGGLAFAIWTQRASLQECADRLELRAESGAVGEDTTCTIFGQEVTVPGVDTP